MLVYAKIVDGETKLFGTLGNIPDESDKELTYKDSTGAAVEIKAGGVYVTFSENGTAYVSKVEESGTTTPLSVYIGDTLIIGKAAEASEEETEEPTTPEEGGNTESGNAGDSGNAGEGTGEEAGTETGGETGGESTGEETGGETDDTTVTE